MVIGFLVLHCWMLMHYGWKFCCFYYGSLTWSRRIGFLFFMFETCQLVTYEVHASSGPLQIFDWRKQDLVLSKHWLYLLIASISCLQKTSPPGAVGTSLALETIIEHSSADIKPFRQCTFSIGFKLTSPFRASFECWLVSNCKFIKICCCCQGKLILDMLPKWYSLAWPSKFI